MVVDETQRERLRTGLLAVLDQEDAETLMAALRERDDLATRADVDALGARFEERFAAIDQRFEAIERRLDGMDQRFAAIQLQLARFDERFATTDERITRAKFEVIGTLSTAMITQTRTMIFTMAGTVVALGGMALTLSRFG
jgi:chromosome segregation ATPase